jgi:hypothetical protein
MAATRERHEAEKTWLKDRTSEVAKLWLRPYSAGDRLAAVRGERVGMEAKPLRRERGGGQRAATAAENCRSDPRATASVRGETDTQTSRSRWPSCNRGLSERFGANAAVSDARRAVVQEGSERRCANQRAAWGATGLHLRADNLGPNSGAHPHFTQRNMA